MRQLIMSPIAGVVMALALTGCNGIPKKDPDFAPMRPPVIPIPEPDNGAIFQAGFSQELFTDRQARRVGDILTVNLVENLSGTSTSETAVDKANNTNITNPTILGVSPEFDLPSGLPLAVTKALNLATTLTSTSTFAGESDAAKANTLTGNISVTVVEVYPNGNVFVRGEKRLTVNEGREFIRLSGIVRKGDIQADNTVDSTKIADASIYYVGEGQAADSNKMGWLARFFNSAIFPF
jgi:flagellar L-ring protein FlgH